jgi:hypothetical protein
MLTLPMWKLGAQMPRTRTPAPPGAVRTNDVLWPDESHEYAQAVLIVEFTFLSQVQFVGGFVVLRSPTLPAPRDTHIYSHNVRIKKLIGSSHVTIGENKPQF